MGGGNPISISRSFALWGLKLSDLVHTFGGCVGMLSSAQQAVFVRVGGVVISIGA